MPDMFNQFPYSLDLQPSSLCPQLTGPISTSPSLIHSRCLAPGYTLQVFGRSNKGAGEFNTRHFLATCKRNKEKSPSFYSHYQSEITPFHSTLEIKEPATRVKRPSTKLD